MFMLAFNFSSPTTFLLGVKRFDRRLFFLDEVGVELGVGKSLFNALLLFSIPLLAVFPMRFLSEGTMNLPSDPEPEPELTAPGLTTGEEEAGGHGVASKDIVLTRGAIFLKLLDTG